MKKDAKDIAQMFDAIANSYDKLNNILTLGIDKLWRKKMVKIILPLKNKTIIDIACGTGKLSLEMAKHYPKKIEAVDISEKMIDCFNKTIEEQKLGETINCNIADVVDLPFNDNEFDIATISFGIRNFNNIEASLHEIKRILKQNGIIIIMEFFNTKLINRNFLYRFYMKSVLPFIGKIISKHSWAYNYLFNSIDQFMSEKEFIKLLETTGFSNCRKKTLLFGMAHIVWGNKK